MFFKSNDFFVLPKIVLSRSPCMIFIDGRCVYRCYGERGDGGGQLKNNKPLEPHPPGRMGGINNKYTLRTFSGWLVGITSTEELAGNAITAENYIM